MLVGAGTTTPDTVVLSTAGMHPSVLHLYFQGDAAIVAGRIYGDGVRCTGGRLLRIGAKLAVEGASIYPDTGEPTITARCAALGFPIAPGTTRIYQVQYREPDAAFCPPPVGANFNASNAVEITW